MSSFSNKFSAYTMTQLNEILEDDEKLTKMVQEMDEVREGSSFCSSVLASLLFSLGLFFSFLQAFVVLSQHTLTTLTGLQLVFNLKMWDPNWLQPKTALLSVDIWKWEKQVLSFNTPGFPVCFICFAQLRAFPSPETEACLWVIMCT